MPNKPFPVEFHEGSPIGEFDCGPYSGHITYVRPRSQVWDPSLCRMRRAVPGHWEITLHPRDRSGEGAWRSVHIPGPEQAELTRLIRKAMGLIPVKSIVIDNGTYGRTYWLDKDKLVDWTTWAYKLDS